MESASWKANRLDAYMLLCLGKAIAESASTGEKEDDVENDDVEGEENDDTEDADAEEEEGRSQDRAARFVWVCAAEINVGMAQEHPKSHFCVEICWKYAEPRTQVYTLCEPAQAKYSWTC